MKIVFNREDVMAIVMAHAAELLQCDLNTLLVDSSYHYSDHIDITVLDKPKPAPVLHPVTDDLGDVQQLVA